MAEYSIFQAYFDPHIYLLRGINLIEKCDTKKLEEFGAQYPTKCLNDFSNQYKIDHCYLNGLKNTPKLFLFKNNYFGLLKFKNLEIISNIEEIYYIAKYATLKTLKLFFKKNKDIILENFKHFCSFSSLENIKFLIENGLDFSNLPYDPFESVCVGGSSEVAKFFVENNFYNPNDIERYIYEAVSHCNYSVIKFLVENGFSVQNNHLSIPLVYTVNFECQKVFNFLIENGHPGDYDSIIQACLLGNLEMVKILIEKGIDINNHNLLENACQGGNLKIVKLLVKNNIKIDKKIIYSITQACKENNYEIVKFLIDICNKKDIKIKKIISHYDLLEIAYENDNLKIMEILLQNEIEIKNKHFEWICKNNKLEMLKLVFKYGRNLNFKDAAKIAVQNRFDNMIDYLQSINLITKSENNLLMACKNGDFNKVKRSKYIRCYEDQPLVEACAEGHIKIVKYLIDNDCDINCQHGKPLAMACLKQNMELIKFLIDNGASVNSDFDLPFNMACKSGNLKIVKFLIKNGFEPMDDAIGGYIETCINNHTHILKFLIEKNIGVYHNVQNEFNYACENKFYEIIDILIKYPAINDEVMYIDFEHPLKEACKTGNLEIVKLLIDVYDVNIMDMLESSEELEYGFFMTAFKHKQIEIVKYLLEKGLPVDILNGLMLIESCKQNNFEFVKMLVEYGANLDIQEGEPLIQAFKNENYEIANFLIENGANPGML